MAILIEATGALTHAEVANGLEESGLDKTTVFHNLNDLVGRTEVGSPAWQFPQDYERLEIQIQPFDSVSSITSIASANRSYSPLDFASNRNNRSDARENVFHLACGVKTEFATVPITTNTENNTTILGFKVTLLVLDSW